MTKITEVDPCDPRGLFFDDKGRIAKTPTSLAAPDARIDEDAVFSLLQFDAIIPPLSPWVGVHRFVSGQTYNGTKRVRPMEMPEPITFSKMTPAEQVTAGEQLLDETMRKQLGDRTDPVVLFSGGVDSGLIAARLKAMGYDDTLLINYAFGDNDPESELAEAMAKHLNLRFEKVTDTLDLCNCLERPGKIWPVPYGCKSTVPSSELAFGAAELLGDTKRVIFEGSGADVIFGTASKSKQWEQVYQVPEFVRKLAALPYPHYFWKHGGKAEYYSRILTRSVQMPFLAAACSHNPLGGDFYLDHQRRNVEPLIQSWIEGWGGTSTATQLLAADLVILGSNVVCQKVLYILESAGHSVAFPFLDNKALACFRASVDDWKMAEEKAPLKEALLKHVPRDMVYRPKSGLTDPKARIFHHPKFLEYLRAALEPSAPFSHLLYKDKYLKAIDRLSRGEKIPLQTQRLMWVTVFSDRWYRTAH